MKKAFNVVFKIFEYFSALTLAVMVALMFMQVLFRFVFHSPLAWTEELARYTFIWSTFIASCVAAVKGEHVALGMLLERTKGAVRTVLVFLSNGLTAAFFAIASYTIAVQWNKLCTQTSAALRIPMSYVYLGIIIGCGGMFLWYTFCAVKGLVSGLRGKEGA